MNEIKELLFDVVSLHSYVGEWLVLGLLILFNILYFLKKTKFYQALIIDVTSIGLACVFFINTTRINEWAGWYIYNSDVYNKFVSGFYLDWLISGLAIILIIVKIILYFYFKKQNK